VIRIGTNPVPLSDYRDRRPLAASGLCRRRHPAAFADCRGANQASLHLRSPVPVNAAQNLIVVRSDLRLLHRRQTAEPAAVPLAWRLFLRMWSDRRAPLWHLARKRRF